jgi:hypothetical protein
VWNEPNLEFQWAGQPWMPCVNGMVTRAYDGAKPAIRP